MIGNSLPTRRFVTARSRSTKDAELSPDTTGTTGSRRNVNYGLDAKTSRCLDDRPASFANPIRRRHR
jgi:hypothetical protein